jgi:hypothetical protein
VIVTQGLHFQSFDPVAKKIRRHQEASGELIGLDLLGIDAGTGTGIPRRNQMTAVDVDMFARLELMPQMEMGNFMGNREPLALVRVTVLYGDRRGITLADQKT